MECSGDVRLGKGLTVDQALQILRRMIVEAKRNNAYGTFSIRLGAEGTDVKAETSLRYPA